MNHAELYIVATPIGNLLDITTRAINTLESVDYIAAEDTRHSKKLLQHFNINTQLISLHDHNEAIQTDNILKLLGENKSIALISDAGTPLINDPGYKLVTKAKSQGIKVIPIPGPCSVIAALSASGISCNNFLFTGFLPSKELSKIDALKQFIHSSYTTVFFEAPHRIAATINTLHELLLSDKLDPNTRTITIAREITKQYETIITDNISNLNNTLKIDPNMQRGEIVVILEGQTKQNTPEEHINPSTLEELLSQLLSELPLKQAVILATKITKLNKNKIYKLALTLNEKKV